MSRNCETLHRRYKGANIMNKNVTRMIKRITSLVLVTTVTMQTLFTAYAGEGMNTTYVAEQERTGVPYVLQCENFDSQCGSSKIDGEVVETRELATLHDGIMATLDEDTVINTTDYLGNSVISNEQNTYSTNMYNANAGTVNLSETIVAESTIGFGASEVNGDGAVLYSKNGDINFYCGTVNFTGVIYAPNGTVRFEGTDINVSGVIIAKSIVVRAGSFKVNYNTSVAELADTLDYIETNQIYGLTVSEDIEKEKTFLQWEESSLISSVEVYARYDENGFEKLDNIDGSEYEISTAGDYRVIVNTVYGEEISSNIVTLVEDEEGYLYEDTIDTDEDGIPDGYEYLIGTEANVADTDDDGYPDGYEVFVLYTNPLTVDENEDFDADGIKNLEELVLGTNPYLADSDFDGIKDSADTAPMKTNVNTGVEADYTIPVKVGTFDLVSKYVDDEGNKCAFVFNYLNGQIKYISDSINESFNVYNQENQLTAAIEYIGGNVIANTYSYSGNNIETITHNGFQYQFQYDEDGNMTDVKVGDRTLITNKFSDGQLLEEMYGNGHTNQFVYDENGNITAQKVNGTTAYEWEYDECGNVTEYRDILRNEVLSYTYDEEYMLTAISSNAGFSINYTEDESSFSVSYEYKGNTKTQTVSANEGITTTELISKGQLVSVVLGEENEERTLYVNGNGILSSKYTYSNLGVSKIEYQDGRILEYTYDEIGNIIVVAENGEEKLSYEYDSLGQLTRENNAYANRTYIYEYDNAGNILAVTEYPYSTGELSGEISEKTYGYEDDNWKDLLTNFNGKSIIYDEIGNPLEYRDNMKFAWSGRQLTSVKDGSNEISYTYNSDGFRTSKTVNGVTTYYHLEGAKIVAETTEDVTIWYIYDENDAIVGFEYQNGVYYFEKNAQGDILRIYDENGNAVSEYVYDAWGNVVAIQGSKEIAQANPFRYRGYYQDNETGFYYLQSRYYDSYVGRFLNADDTVSLGITGTSLAYNLFSYCENSPVIYKDETGYTVDVVFDIISAIWSLADLIAKPSWKNALFLLWDLAATVVPFVPGSYVAKGGKLAIRVASSVEEFSQGTKFLTGSYKDLSKLFNGKRKANRIEIHHLVEQRFSDLFKGKTDDYLSVPLGKELHKTITGRWRDLYKKSSVYRYFEYGRNYKNITKSQMKRAIKEVYKDMPQLLKETLEWFEENWKG